MMKINFKIDKTFLLLISTLFLISSSAFAVDPITPPNETAKITVNEDVYVVGMQDSYTKTEKHSLDYQSPQAVTVTVDGDDVFSDQLKKAMINYTNNINAIDGDMHIVEDFSYDLSSDELTPNLKTKSHINFLGASLSKTEKAEAGISEIKGFSDYADGNNNVCINKNGACWDAAVGTHIDVSYIESSLQTDLDITHSPYIHQSVSANGTGLIESGMTATFKEGSERIYTNGSCPLSASASTMQYDSHTYAHGKFEFSKDMKNFINNLNTENPSTNIDKVP